MIYLEIYVVLLVVVLLLIVKVDIATKTSKTVDNKKELSGFEAARNVLDDNKLEKTYIIEKKGKVVDYYDYNNKVIKLSSLVFHENTLYALGVGSYVGMHGAYDIKNNSIYKFIATFKPLANIIYYISLFLIIAGMYTANETAYQVALLLLVLILIFSTIMFVCKRNIAYEAYDYLKNNKCFKKEEDDMLSTVLRNVYLESYTWLITDLFYPVINLITQRK